jgi:hypothetical protein
LRPKENQEELKRQNELNFIEASHANKDGPLKYLDKDQIEAVHREADERL